MSGGEPGKKIRKEEWGGGGRDASVLDNFGPTAEPVRPMSH